MATYNNSNGWAGGRVDAALVSAESALQNESVDTLAKLNALIADATLFPTDEGTLNRYAETGTTLTSSAGVLDIPLDGRIYQVTVTEEITSITTSAAPTAPLCGSAVVYFTQGATGYAVATPATWRWPDSTAGMIDATANAESELMLNTNPAGNVIARVSAIGVPA